eukprot:TRINITY_DN1902_c0_g1_i1.p1 TRINITY_DN1902_c0_g1~~TRINITY_DN1902_c0_g1_i1.p1  ORF type:complete len:1141 (+),score=423.41 TRINITY_DN1902_c0_g1_i1:187-3609(+)
MATTARRQHQHLLRDAHEEMHHRLNLLSARQQEAAEQAYRVNIEKMFAVREELQRKHNCQQADELMSQEHARRINDQASGYHPLAVEAALKRVQEQLVRHHAALVADRAMRDEQLQRVASNTFEHVLEELQSKAARQTARDAESRERQRRSTLPSASLAQSHPEVMEALIRHVHQRQVLRAMEEERQYRLAQQQHDIAMDELIRAVACARVDRACTQEQQERVQRDLMGIVLDDAVRVVNAKHADHCADIEKDQRIAQDLHRPLHEELFRHHALRHVAKDIQQAQAEAASAPLPKPDEHHTLLCEAVIHEAQRRQVKQRMDVEQAQRIAQDKMQQQVLPTMLSEMGRRTTKDMELTEQAQRIAQDKMQRLVMPDLERHHSQCAVVKAMEQERAERMTREQGLDVAQELVSVVGAGHADKAMAQEQAERIAQDHHLEVLTEVHRQMHARNADAAMAAEQQRRENEPLHANSLVDVLVAELDRHFAVEQATMATEVERTQRIAQGWMREHVLDELERCHAWRMVDSAMDVEQAQRVQIDCMHDVLDQLVRVVACKQADADMDQEQQERLNRQRFDQVVEQLQRKSAQSSAIVGMEFEQAQRVQQEKFALVAEELFRAHARRLAKMAVAEFRDEMGLDEEDVVMVSPVDFELNASSQALHDELVALVEQRQQVRNTHAIAMEQLCNAVTHKQFDSRYRSVLSQLERQVSRTSTWQQEAAEQSRRVEEDLHQGVMSSIRRAIACKQADDAMDREQRQRVLRNMQHDQALEQERISNAHQADRDADAEQSRRVAEGGDVDPSIRYGDEQVLFREAIVAEAHRRQALRAEAIAKMEQMAVMQFDAVMDQLRRQHNLCEVKSAYEAELALAKHQHAWDRIMDDVVAKVHRQTTITACEHERQIAVNKHMMDSVVAQVQEQGARHEAAHLEEDERQRRVAEGKAILPLALLQVQEEAAAQGRRKQLDAIEEEERAERVHHDKFVDVMSQLSRQASLTEVKHLVKAEQQRQMSIQAMDHTLDQLLSVQHRKHASKQAKLEQLYQMEHSRQPDASLMNLLAAVHEQLLHHVNRKLAIKMEQAEQLRRLHQDSRDKLFEEMYRAVNHHDVRVASKGARQDWIAIRKSSSPLIQRRHSNVMIEMQLHVAAQH